MVDLSQKDALDDALELLHFAFRKTVEAPDRVLAKHGLGRVHHRVLFFVRRRAGLSVGELRAVLAVSKQALPRPPRELHHGG
jgi:DNA-binding MarR family transcriptional regulator